MDLEELEEMDASETHAKRLNAKEAKMPDSGEMFIIPVADGTGKPFGGHQVLRTSTLVRNQPIRGVNHQDILEESEGYPPPLHFQDSFPDAGEARDEFWSISGDFKNGFRETSCTAITLNQESNSTRQEKNHFLFH